jgi:DNA-binding NarL/FixJ family response regulator
LSVRALWIEDHHLIGDALELLLQLVLPQLSLDKARDADSALQLARSIPYEIVMLDWWLDGHDGEALLGALRKAGCTAPIVVVSGDEREPVQRRALQLGVAAFVRKSAPPEQLIETLRAVLAGRPAPGAQASTQPAAPLPALDVATLYPQLSPRQLDVFRALLRGASDKQIARELHIAETTVKTHVRVILNALGVKSRGEAAHAARSAGG